MLHASQMPADFPESLAIYQVGAGFAGINTAIRIDQHLTNVELDVYEKNSSVGGTW